MTSLLRNGDYAMVYREGTSFRREALCLIDVCHIVQSIESVTNYCVSPVTVDDLPSEMIYKVTLDFLYSCLMSIERMDRSELRIKRLHLVLESDNDASAAEDVSSGMSGNIKIESSNNEKASYQKSTDEDNPIALRDKVNPIASRDKVNPIASREQDSTDSTVSGLLTWGKGIIQQEGNVLHSYSTENCISAEVNMVNEVKSGGKIAAAVQRLINKHSPRKKCAGRGRRKKCARADRLKKSVVPSAYFPHINNNMVETTAEHGECPKFTDRESACFSMKIKEEGTDLLSNYEGYKDIDKHVVDEPASNFDIDSWFPIVEQIHSDDGCPAVAHVDEDQTVMASNRCLTKKKKDKLNMVDNSEDKQGMLDLKCSICSMDLSSKHNLMNHMRIHTGEKPFQCEICGRSFTRKIGLKLHSTIHTTERPFICTTCGKSFRHKGGLLTHTIIHTGERPYPCQICGDGFKSRSALNSHMFVHSKKKPHSCEVCGRCFAQRGNLVKHFAVHGEPKHKYKCEVCDKTFQKKEKMKVHKRGHTGEKPYLCDFCGKGFTSSTYLWQHRKSHDAVSYKCPNCGKIYSWSQTLQQHLKTCIKNE